MLIINSATKAYTLEKKLGQGDFGTVYFAKTHENTPVAIKFFHSKIKSE